MLHPLSRVLPLALALALCPWTAQAAEARSHDEERPNDALDEERAWQDRRATDAAPAKEIAPKSSDPAAGRGDLRSGGGVPVENAPLAGHSLAFDVGGAAAVMGGLAFPKIPLNGTPDNSWHAPGLGAAFQIHANFPAMDLDWRFGARGALPGYLGLWATAGIRKELAPWTNPHFVARGGAGLELMLASARGATFLLPVFLAEGEAAVEVMIVPQSLGLGAGLDVDLRYGLPLGIGFNIGGFLRANLWF